MDWNPLLNWRLLASSHEFPGPDGGTCINEAAIVAAGFEYRAVTCVHDCPPCFSRVIATYALQLNDSMPDALRQELLMPFVVRLAGTADSSRIEADRAGYIAIQIVRRILPIALRAKGLDKHAQQCEQVSALHAAQDAAYAADIADAIAAVAYATEAVFAITDAAAAAAFAARSVAGAARVAATAQRKIFALATAILDEAIKLGNHGDDLDIGLIVQRMDDAKRLVRA